MEDGVESGTNADMWYGSMLGLIGVPYRQATVHDFQLYFHCGGQAGGTHQKDCSAVPCECSKPPCKCWPMKGGALDEAAYRAAQIQQLKKRQPQDNYG